MSINSFTILPKAHYHNMTNCNIIILNMKAIVKAVFIMSFFTFFDRLLGFFFKIYLSIQLGAEMMGVYQVALSTFMVLVTLITSGMPLVVSKQTAKLRANKQIAFENSTATAAFLINIVVAVALTTIIFIFNRAIGSLFANDLSRTALLFMVPALVFSSIYASLRGNLWGRGKYTAVSLLEIAEQFARIGTCVLLFGLGFDRLRVAAFAMTIGCIVAALTCVICFFATGARFKNPKGFIKPLIKQASPVTAGRAATAAVNGLIAIVVPFLLISRAGLSQNEAMYQFGFSMGMAMPLLFIPLTFVGSLAFVMIPTLSKAMAAGDKDSIKRQTEAAIKMSIVLGGLFFPLFFALGEPIGLFVYRNADSGRFLRAAAWLLLPISIESITSSMMNSLDMELRSFIHYLIGAAVMFSSFLIAGSAFNIHLMAVGMGSGWILSSVLNIWAIKRKAGFRWGFLFTLLVSAGLTIPAIFITQGLYSILGILPTFLRIFISGGFGILFMILMNFVFGNLKIEYFYKNKGSKKKKSPLFDKAAIKAAKAFGLPFLF